MRRSSKVLALLLDHWQHWLKTVSFVLMGCTFEYHVISAYWTLWGSSPRRSRSFDWLRLELSSQCHWNLLIERSKYHRLLYLQKDWVEEHYRTKDRYTVILLLEIKFPSMVFQWNVFLFSKLQNLLSTTLVLKFSVFLRRYFLLK